MRLNDLASETPAFDFRVFFEGRTRASGWFADRFGRPRRHFRGDFVGRRDGAELVLDETLRYTDGVVEERLWRVSVDDDGRFRATGDALLGEASGRMRGNALGMRYRMRVAVGGGRDVVFDFEDLMLLQPDGCLHNLVHVRKWGVRVGSVATQYVRHARERENEHGHPRERRSRRALGVAR